MIDIFGQVKVHITGIMSTKLLWLTFQMTNDLIIPISVYFFNNDTWTDTTAGMWINVVAQIIANIGLHWSSQFHFNGTALMKAN